MELNSDMSTSRNSEILGNTDFCSLKLANLKQAIFKTSSFSQKESSTHIQVEKVQHSKHVLNHKSSYKSDISAQSEFYAEYSPSMAADSLLEKEALLYVQSYLSPHKTETFPNIASSTRSELFHKDEKLHPHNIQTTTLDHSPTFINDAHLGKLLESTSSSSPERNEESSSFRKDKMEENSNEANKLSKSKEDAIDPKVLEEIEDFEKLVAQHVKQHQSY